MVIVMDKFEIIKEVKDRTEIGKSIVIMELNYLKWMAKQ